ncbi:IPT/TIG domain-containing protein [Kitasatospora purpeofusca]|uniref:IPT/TIG domain-containing protein n=1 Tax=Kitasatospora purpeofusca TaxID=67352 RepID=UPI0036CB84B2
MSVFSRRLPVAVLLLGFLYPVPAIAAERPTTPTAGQHLTPTDGDAVHPSGYRGRQAPRLSNAVPSTGKEGDQILLRGTGLGDVTTAVFSVRGLSASASVVSTRDSTVYVHVPRHLDEGTGTVYVTDSTGASSNAVQFTIIAP